MSCRFRLRPTYPDILGLQKACQDEYGTAPTLVLTHLSHLEDPWWFRREPLDCGIIKLWFRLGVQRATKPTFPEVLGDCIGDHCLHNWGAMEVR